MGDLGLKLIDNNSLVQVLVLVISRFSFSINSNASSIVFKNFLILSAYKVNNFIGSD